MSKSPPPIPAEQKSFHGQDSVGRRDADVNLKEQGRQGNIHQNVDKSLHARSGDR